jgi:drug/metabolite transporter (DMT)-like permease
LLRYWVPQKNEFIADHCIWRRRTCFELWIFIPPELSMFRLIAAIGMMVGHRVGQLVGGLVRRPPKRFLILIVGAVLCFYFAIGYAGMIQMGSANTSDIVNLGVVLGLFFLTLGFLLPFTRALVPNEIEILWSKAIEYFARLFRG